jgi:hypothetical protein
MSSIEIVIARYNENLEWVLNIPKEYKIYVYNKSNNINELNYIKNVKNLKIIQQPNIGRESHTYLTHIINNYNNLSDKIVFTQGDPIFHNEKFIELLNNHEKFDIIQPLSAYYDKTTTPPKEILNKTKNLWLDNLPIHLDYTDIQFRTMYPYYYYTWNEVIINAINDRYDLYDYIKNELNIKNIRKKYLIPFCYAAIFSVTKKIIHTRTIEFYNKILNFLIYDKQIMLNKKIIDNGYIIERLWMSIFNYQKFSKKYIKIKSKKYKNTKFNLNIINNTIDFDMLIVCEKIYCIFYFGDLIGNKLIISKNNIILNGMYNYTLQTSNENNLNKLKLHIKISVINDIFEIMINNKCFYRNNYTSKFNLHNCYLYDIFYYNKVIDNNTK